MRRWLSLRVVLLGTILSLVATTFYFHAARAATPSSGAINTPPDNTLGVRQAITYFGGPMLVSTGFSNESLPACLQAVAPPGACDVFNLAVNLPANYWDTHAGNLTVKLTWTADLGLDPSNNDLDLYVVDAQGNTVAFSADTNPKAAGGTGAAQEIAVAANIPGGAYRIIVIDSTSTSNTPRFDVVATFSLTQPPPPPPSTAKIFEIHTPPVVNGARLGTSAGEPSIGVNWVTGNAMYQANTQTLRVTFDDVPTPSTSTWTNVGSTITSVHTFDAILFTDLKTHRTFVAQNDLHCSLGAFTDDDGQTWFQNPIGCGLGTLFDHQTVGGGPFAPGLSANDPINHYQNSVVYCAHDDATAACAISTDGGITYSTPPNVMYNITQCGGLHGHVRSGPDGILYVPNKNCGSQQALVVSTDNGKTWTIRPIPGSKSGNSDPWVDVGPNNTVYVGYADGTGHAFVAVSRDHGQTWSTPYDVGATQGVLNTEFAAVITGDDNRAAMAFLGTATPGDDQGAAFQGVWYLYTAFTYDGGVTWTTYDATPGDPVQRGCIWLGGGINSCRNLLDFNGITVDKFGRVLVAFADGCIDDPLNSANQCVSKPPAGAQNSTKTELASIARQSGGVGLFAKYDGQVFKTVPDAPVLAGQAGNAVNHLTWTVASNGGAVIANYKIYRATASNAETLLTTVGNVNTYDDTAVLNGTTYYYRVSAVNAIGEGATSNEVALTPAFSAAPSSPLRLKARGRDAGISLSWSAPKSSGTAPITGYNIYRGTASGAETLLASVGNTTMYNDDAAAPGITYYYYVRAVNSVGVGPASNEDNAVVKSN